MRGAGIQVAAARQSWWQAALFAVISAAVLAGCSPQSQQTALAQDSANSQVQMPADAEVVMKKEQQLPAAVGSSELQAMYQDIVQLVGQAKASSVAQCRVVGLGAKPCGGPQSYLVYSAEQGNETELLAKVARYNLLVQQHNQQLELMSDCAVVPKPGVVLVDGVCQAGPPGDLM